MACGTSPAQRLIALNWDEWPRTISRIFLPWYQPDQTLGSNVSAQLPPNHYLLGENGFSWLFYQLCGFSFEKGKPQDVFSLQFDRLAFNGFQQRAIVSYCYRFQQAHQAWIHNFGLTTPTSFGDERSLKLSIVAVFNKHIRLESRILVRQPQSTSSWGPNSSFRPCGTKQVGPMCVTLSCRDRDCYPLSWWCGINADKRPCCTKTT